MVLPTLNVEKPQRVHQLQTGANLKVCTLISLKLLIDGARGRQPLIKTWWNEVTAFSYEGKEVD